jgi:hypothetical protein
MQFSGEELIEHLLTRAETLRAEIQTYADLNEPVLKAAERMAKQYEFMAKRMVRHGIYFLTSAELQSIEMEPF